MKAKSSKKRLQISKELWTIVPQYFAEAHAAKAEGRPVGWMPPMNGAIEVFRAMDITPIMPENWSPICAATGLAPECMEAAERMGYSRDLCGYLRNAIGYINEAMKKPDQPFGGQVGCICTTPRTFPRRLPCRARRGLPVYSDSRTGRTSAALSNRTILHRIGIRFCPHVAALQYRIS